MLLLLLGGGGSTTSCSLDGDLPGAPVSGQIDLVPNHATDGLSQLIAQYQESERLKWVIGLPLCVLNAAEISAYDLLTKVYDVDAAEGVQLDILGDIVGESRSGRTDKAFRRAIKVRVAVNKSNGTAEELINICVLYTDIPLLGIDKVAISDFGVAAIKMVLSFFFDDVPGLFNILKQARPAGVQLNLCYPASTAPSFAFSGTYATAEVSSTEGFGSVYTSSGGELSGIFTG